MNNVYYIIGAILVIAVIVIAYYKRYEIARFIKSESFKELVHNLMIKAEKIYSSGEGKDKLEYVVTMAIRYLPVSIQTPAKKFVILLVEELFELYKKTYTDENGITHSIIIE